MLKRDKRYGLRTRAVHAGEGPDPVTGASAPNLVMSTTFVLDEAGGSFSGMIAFQTQDGPKLAQQFSERLEVFHYAVSLGHHRSLIFYLTTDDLQKNSFRLDADHLAR